MNDATEEQRRHELTLEALKDVDEGRTISHERVLEWVEVRKRNRRRGLHHDPGGAGH